MRVLYRWRRFKPYYYNWRNYKFIPTKFWFYVWLYGYILSLLVYSSLVKYIAVHFGDWLANCCKYTILTYIFIITFWYYFNIWFRQFYRHLVRCNIYYFRCYKLGYYEEVFVGFLWWILGISMLISVEWVVFIFSAILYSIYMTCVFVGYGFTMVFIVHPYRIVRRDWTEAYATAKQALFDYTAKIEYPINYLGVDCYDSSSFLFLLDMLY